jgi:anti-sigma regulatory factor (Ser/Thr protein kinase)
MIVEVADSSQVAAARRAAAKMAVECAFDEERAGRVALIATEMASNLLKHAGRGVIAIERYGDSSGAGLELLSLNKGDGIANIATALSDGYSTAGSIGGGFGVMRRQADEFSLYSKPQKGASVLARVAKAAKQPAADDGVVFGSVIMPYPGETACGDAGAYESSPSGPTLFLADGSGHGFYAEVAAQTAVRVFRENVGESCARIAELVHKALIPTRGAAIAVARVDRAERIIRFVGIGNIAGAVFSESGLNRMVSHGGTAGHIASRIREFVYPYSGTPTVILHSDGLSAKWDLDDYPGLGVSHPALIAGILFRDFARGRDDASVIALRG